MTLHVVNPVMPEGYSETSIEWMQWIRTHYDHLRAIFKDEDHFLEYLKYDVADPQARDLISRFPDIPVNWWGKTNVNKSNEVL